MLEMSDSLVNYYTVLECDKTASSEELKRSYQRLLLSSHPDKNSEGTDEKFLLVQKAWSVLRDPECRKQYDATLKCQEHSEVLLYDTILLTDMTLDSDNTHTYNCRCGGTYVLEDKAALNCDNSVYYIACDECSFSIQVKRLTLSITDFDRLVEPHKCMWIIQQTEL